MNITDKYITVFCEAWAKKYMENFVDYLYELNFRLVSSGLIEESTEIKGDIKHLQFLVRMSKIDRDPKKDVYDFTLVIGLDYLNKGKEVYVWLGGQRYRKGKKNWEHPKKFNFKPKKKLTKYPDHMSIQDRIDFRRVESKFVRKRPMTDKELEFYKLYAEDVYLFNKNR